MLFDIFNKEACEENKKIKVLLKLFENSLKFEYDVKGNDETFELDKMKITFHLVTPCSIKALEYKDETWQDYLDINCDCVIGDEIQERHFRYYSFLLNKARSCAEDRYKKQKLIRGKSVAKRAEVPKDIPTFER